MIEKVAEYMEQWHMVEPGDTVIAGVSGGADSICLCCILLELVQRMNFTVRVVHVEHGIRGEESMQDARFVEQFCSEHKIACATYSVDVPSYVQTHKLGEEEAARLLRYEILRKEAGKTPQSRIALAHHMEDNAETLLFQMARGSDVDGLCGIRPVRTEADCIYIRPLLCVSRAEIEQELHRRSQAYCTDATNVSMEYSRNRIRHKILPELEQINARAVMHLNRTAERMNELREYLEEQTVAAASRIVKTSGEAVTLDVEALREQPHIVQTRVVHEALAKAAGVRRDLQSCHVVSVLELADKQSGRRVNLPYRLTAERRYGQICIFHETGALQERPVQAVISGQMLSEALRDGKKREVVAESQGRFYYRIFQFDGNLSEIPRKMYTKWFDYDKIKLGFSIRTRRNQDYFVMDAHGHRQKIADYFINEKIPAPQRERIPLIAAGEEILWIVGGRMGCTAQITPESRMILELTYEGGARDGF